MREYNVKPPAIEAADLQWRDGIPESRQFGDVYFSRDNGLEETRYVFLQQNGLPERFQALKDDDVFVVAETGFGTGLNFLATWQAWQQHRPPNNAILHFVSAERFPIAPEDLARALELWPELKPLADELLASYPPLFRGTHRLVLDEGGVRLTLFFGDVVDAWSTLTFQADAWFLDGFAPACNPEMWLDEGIRLIRRHSKAGTTIATFTAVGRIRRALQSQGFAMRKAPGFGRKRDMIVGHLPSGEAEPVQARIPGPIAIIGAGLAGSLLANNLAQRGVEVVLIDAGQRAGAGASGNLQGASYVKLGVDFNAQTELALTALNFAYQAYEPYRDSVWHPTGLLQLAWSEQESDRQTRFLDRNHYPESLLYPVDASTATDLTGVPCPSGGLWFPRSGWLAPQTLCQRLVDHPRIHQRFGVKVQRLTPCNGKWHIASDGGPDTIVESLVIAAGHLTPTLIPLQSSFRFKAIRGQVTHLPEGLLKAPGAVICGEKYLNPMAGNIAVTGATFDLHNSDPQPTGVSNQENLEKLRAMLPDAFNDHGESSATFEGRVGFRCTTHDYQPVVGPVKDMEGRSLDGVYLFTGLGSKGISYAPLLAEYLADRLLGHPEAIPGPLQKLLDPGRMIRAKTKDTRKNTELSFGEAVK